MSAIIPPFDAQRDHYQCTSYPHIELVEYGDFLCGDCCRAYPEVKYLQDALGDQLRFIYRNLPPSAQHPLAIPAMLAAEAAGRQGKFWYMHDIIFENQSFLRAASFRKFASDIGMDVCLFDQDVRDTKLLDKLKSDWLSSASAHLKRSPTFFINGKRYTDFPDFSGLLASCFHLLNIDIRDKSSQLK